MVTSILKDFIVRGYNEVYDLYKEGELGVVEQRMGVIPKWEVGVDGTDKELILKLLARDEDNLYNVVQISDTLHIGDGNDSYFHISMLGVIIEKTFTEPVQTYELMFGEDGKWESVYQVDDPTNPKDGTVFGELNVVPFT